jgi:glucose/arabinose dehydrogenase
MACGCGQPGPNPSPAPTVVPTTTPSPTPSPTASPAPPLAPILTFVTADGVRCAVHVIAARLEAPWSMAFAPDGRLFVTERPGRVRIVENGVVLPAALTLTDVAAEGEAGLLGLALHPDFERTRFVYLLYTARASGRMVNRLVRYREVNNQLGEAAVLMDNIPAAGIHDGGRVRFGPDGRLYITMGDAANASLAQSLSSLAGKILRINEDGTTPGDNPFSSPIWSYGHRNPQGIDWRPDNGDLWETEHGQTANDEVNRIERSRNYGWPVIEAAQTASGMEPPVFFFPGTAVAPSGASFYRGSLFPAFQGDFFFATLRGVHLHRVRFDPADPRRVAARERLLENRFGRLRDVISGPDGALYIATSNRDGRGAPAADDDRILRISPET